MADGLLRFKVYFILQGFKSPHMHRGSAYSTYEHAAITESFVSITTTSCGREDRGIELVAMSTTAPLPLDKAFY